MVRAPFLRFLNSTISLCRCQVRRVWLQLDIGAVCGAVNIHVNDTIFFIDLLETAKELCFGRFVDDNLGKSSRKVSFNILETKIKHAENIAKL